MKMGSGLHIWKEIQVCKPDPIMRQLLLAGFYDFPEWKVVRDIQLQPYLGLGAGYTNYRLKDFVQQFPDPDDPEGYARRGPNGEIPFTPSPRRKRTEIYIHVEHRRGHTSHQTRETRLELSLYGCGRDSNRCR